MELSFQETPIAHVPLSGFKKISLFCLSLISPLPFLANVPYALPKTGDHVCDWRISRVSLDAKVELMFLLMPRTIRTL